MSMKKEVEVFNAEKLVLESKVEIVDSYPCGIKVFGEPVNGMTATRLTTSVIVNHPKWRSDCGCKVKDVELIMEDLKGRDSIIYKRTKEEYILVYRDKSDTL